jgi:hypothetical protein
MKQLNKRQKRRQSVNGKTKSNASKKKSNTNLKKQRRKNDEYS